MAPFLRSHFVTQQRIQSRVEVRSMRDDDFFGGATIGSCRKQKRGREPQASQTAPWLSGAKEKRTMDANQGIIYWDKLRRPPIEVERAIRTC